MKFINSRWFALHPTHRMDAGYWILVTKLLEVEGITPSEATDEQVKSAIKKLKNFATTPMTAYGSLANPGNPPEERETMVVDMSGAETAIKKAHRERHRELHKALDELLADWIDHQPIGGKSMSNTTVMELAKWSHQQTIDPTEPER